MRERVLELLDGTGNGIVTNADLRELGVGPAALRTLVREGVVVRVVRGAYVKATLMDPPPERARALGHAAVRIQQHLLVLDAVLRVYGRRIAAAHQSAALAWGLPVLKATLDRVRVSHTRLGATGRRFDRYTIHRCEHADAFTTHRGRRVAVPALAVVGTAISYGLKAGVVTADAALHSGLVTRDDLDAWLERLHHHPGLSAARAAVDRADGSSESVGESLLRLLLTRMGIRFIPQFWIRTADGRFYKVDFYLPDLGVVLEFDGLVKYADQEHPDERNPRKGNALAREKLREDAIRAEGYGVGRVVWAGLDEATVRATVATAERQAQPQARRRTSTPPPWA